MPFIIYKRVVDIAFAGRKLAFIALIFLMWSHVPVYISSQSSASLNNVGIKRICHRHLNTKETSSI